jgi:glutaredoxin-like protein NrdH
MTEHDVMIYALKGCRWCAKTKNWFEDEGIPFNHVDVDALKGDEFEAMIEEVERVSGGRNMPVTVIDGHVIVGWRPEEFEQAIKGEAEEGPPYSRG